MHEMGKIVSEVPNGILSRSSNIKEEVSSGRRTDKGCVGP